MTWRDQFQEGSFRGAAFTITEAQTTFGRRNKIFEYPGQDTPGSQDMGASARTWSIDCFVIGDGYMAARDTLMSALLKSGPGTLVHPYLGTLQAVCDPNLTCTETTEAGGMARFSLLFHQAGPMQQPSASVNTQGAAIAAATSTGAAAQTSAAARLQVANQPGFVAQAAAAILGGASTAIGAVMGAVQPIASGLYEAQAVISGLQSDSQQLLQLPDQLAQQLFSAVQGVADLATYADVGLTQVSSLFGFGATLATVQPSTPARTAQAANQLLLCQLVQAAAAAAAVGLVAQTDFVSYDDAASTRDTLAEQLDDLALSVADSGDDTLAGAIDALRIAMIEDVTARGASLARLYQWTPPTTLPAVVIAQRLYADATRADEIVARNGVVDPGAVPGGVALEVLSNA